MSENEAPGPAVPDHDHKALETRVTALEGLRIDKRIKRLEDSAKNAPGLETFLAYPRKRSDESVFPAVPHTELFYLPMAQVISVSTTNDGKLEIAHTGLRGGKGFICDVIDPDALSVLSGRPGGLGASMIAAAKRRTVPAE